MNFEITPCTHFVVIAGSHAYGTNTPESDLDIKGWAIPPTEILISYIQNFEQNDTKLPLKDHPFKTNIESYLRVNKVTCQVDPVDSTIYNLRKFMALAADCNPNIIDLLFTKDAEIIWSDFYGDELREAAPQFLSQRARYSFTGYAMSQLKRIYTHRRRITNPPKKKPEREDYGLPCSSLIPPDQRQAAQALIEKQVRLWLLEEAEVDKVILDQIQDDLLLLIGSILDLKTREEARERVEYVVGKSYGMSEEYLSVLQQEKKYKSALNEFNSYQTWLENRNPARAELEKKFLYDTKHASHLIRLLIEAEEILEKGTLTLKQPEHIEFFKAIKRGAWSFEKLLEWSAEKMAVLSDKNIKSAVPKTVDSKKLDQIYRDLVMFSMEEEKVHDNEQK
jgi:predicted nucleotidyltransferase